MSAVTLPVARPNGRALIIGNAASRGRLVESLGRLGFDCLESDDPYTAIRELSRRRSTVNSLIVSLACLFREELSVVSVVKHRFPQIEIWLAHTDGRQGALAEAIRLGAAGLVDDEGLHRMAPPPVVAEMPSYQPLKPMKPDVPVAAPMMPPPPPEPVPEPTHGNEPVLTADELRALLQETPMLPARNGRSDA